MSGEVIYQLYHSRDGIINCPSLAALARDNYNIVPRVIKLISPHHSCTYIILNHAERS